MIGPRETECLGTSKFDWDPPKHEKNLRKHGVRFEDVIDAFNDLDHLPSGQFDEESGEWRDVMIAMAGNRLYVICYVMREDDGVDLCWLISARPADPKERRSYHNEG